MASQTVVLCFNCDNDAVYTVADPGANPVHYCSVCMPHHLRNQVQIGAHKFDDLPGIEGRRFRTIPSQAMDEAKKDIPTKTRP